MPTCSSECDVFSHVVDGVLIQAVEDLAVSGLAELGGQVGHLNG